MRKLISSDVRAMMEDRESEGLTKGSEAALSSGPRGTASQRCACAAVAASCADKRRSAVNRGAQQRTKSDNASERACLNPCRLHSPLPCYEMYELVHGRGG